jgi:hypothetical protein
MIRYFLYMGLENDAAVLGLRYDSVRERFVVGGYTKFEPAMVGVIESYLPAASDVEKRYVQKNKLQFVVKGIKSKTAFAAFAEMRRSGLTLAATPTFHNLMR